MELALARLCRSICGKAPLFRMWVILYCGSAAARRHSRKSLIDRPRKSKAFPQIDGQSPKKAFPIMARLKK